MNIYTASNFDDFLADENILEEVSIRARKRLLTIQAKEIMAEKQITKSELAERLQTSRSQVDRLLDPENTSVTLDSLDKFASAIGAELRFEFA